MANQTRWFSNLTQVFYYRLPERTDPAALIYPPSAKSLADRVKP